VPTQIVKKKITGQPFLPLTVQDSHISSARSENRFRGRGGQLAERQKLAEQNNLTLPRCQSIRDPKPARRLHVCVLFAFISDAVPRPVLRTKCNDEISHQGL